jgi:hypothetical protein
LGGGRPGPDVYPQYTIDANAVLNNKITTLAYNVTITMCDTGGACPAAGPTFNTSGTATNTSTVTVTLYIVKDKTHGNSIYLDPSGVDTDDGLIRQTGLGGGHGPRRSLGAAAAAAGTNKAIYIKTGSYCATGAPACASTTGTATIQSGTSVYGGYNANWYRPNASLNQASITAGSDASADSIGISIGAVNQAVWIEGLNLTTQRPTPTGVTGYNAIGIRATSGTSTLTLYRNTISTQGDILLAGGSNPGGSYGVYLSGVNRADVLSNSITSGRGWQGSNGPGGGATGGSAPGGGAGPQVGTGGAAGCTACCNDSHTHAAGGAGGTGGAGAANRGGNGGGGGWQDDGNGNANSGQRGGFDGETAPNGGGGGGGGGNNPGSSCTNVDGGGGGTPAAASNGGNGASPSFNFGQIAGSTFLQAFSGSYGADGNQGLGGGGGGGGAGVEGCLNDGGGGGGGGGAGGERGTGGEGGVAGGPSVPLYFNSVSIINASGNTLTRNQGGVGGNGKDGGSGGNPTNGAGGGNGPDDGGAGGSGGNGRTGGSGGDGSGGNGGQSFGMVVYPNVTPTCTVANTHGGGGAASGGTSSGNSGSAGINRQCAIFNSTTPGALTACPAACGSTGP